MGKTEKVIGVLIITLMMISLLFHYPVLNTAIVFLGVMLTMIYFVLSFALLNNIRLRDIPKGDSYKGIGTIRIIGTIFTGFVLSMICTYSLFKFMRWPFADQGLLISLISLMIPMLVVTVKAVKTKSTFYSKFLIRLTIFLVVGASFYFTPTEKILEMKHPEASVDI